MGISYKRRFALLWLGTLFSLLACTATLTRLIDPYGLYESPRWSGINMVKPRPDRSLGDIKLANALRTRPDTLILGNSRADIGFDPKVLIQLGLSRRPYNLAIPGSGLETNVRDLETILQHGIRPNMLVVGLEFFDYLQTGVQASKPLPAPPDDDWEGRHFRLKFQSLFTLAALGDSFATLRAQHASNPATIREDGFNPLLDYITLASNEGYFTLFRQRGLENARRLKSLRVPPNWSRTPDFAALERLIHLAKEFDIRLEFAIYPYHGQILGLLQRNELLTPFTQWKQTLSKRISEAAAEGIRARLWDFSQINHQTMEKIPARGDRQTETRWYWEAGHFKSALGQLMLEQMFAAANQAAPETVGQLIAPPVTQIADMDNALSAILRDSTDLAEDLQQISPSVTSP